MPLPPTTIEVVVNVKNLCIRLSACVIEKAKTYFLRIPMKFVIDWFRYPHYRYNIPLCMFTFRDLECKISTLKIYSLSQNYILFKAHLAMRGWFSVKSSLNTEIRGYNRSLADQTTGRLDWRVHNYHNVDDAEMASRKILVHVGRETIVMWPCIQTCTK